MLIDGLPHRVRNIPVELGCRLDKVHPQILISMFLRDAVVPDGVAQAIAVDGSSVRSVETVQRCRIEDIRHVFEGVVVNDLVAELLERRLERIIRILDDLPPCRDTIGVCATEVFRRYGSDMFGIDVRDEDVGSA